MAVTVKSATLWRREVENRPGALASTLEPLAKARVDLRVVMGYRLPGAESRAVVEVHPVSGKRATEAAATVGLSASTIPALIVEGDNRAGLGHAIAQAISEAGINLAFVLAQVVGRWTGVPFARSGDEAMELCRVSCESHRHDRTSH